MVAAGLAALILGSGCQGSASDPFSGTWLGESDLSQWEESEDCDPAPATEVTGVTDVTLHIFRLADDRVVVDASGPAILVLVGSTTDDRFTASVESETVDAGTSPNQTVFTSSISWSFEAQIDETAEEMDGSFLFESVDFDETFCSFKVPFPLARTQ
jgi:hypothetical protein